MENEKEQRSHEHTRCPRKNVPLDEVCPSPKGTFFLGHPVYLEGWHASNRFDIWVESNCFFKDSPFTFQIEIVATLIQIQ